MDERVERTAETYEAVADTYECLHGDRSDVAHIVQGFSDRVAAAAPDSDHPRLLDAGCGPGWEAATFTEADFEVIGLDFTRQFIEAAQERAPEAAFVRGDMRSLPVASATVDGIFALASLLHVPREDLDTVLGEFANVLRPGGVLSLSTKRSAADLEKSPYEGDDRHVETYEPSDLRECIERAGFAIDDLDAGERWIVIHAERD